MEDGSQQTARDASQAPHVRDGSWKAWICSSNSSLDVSDFEESDCRSLDGDDLSLSDTTDEDKVSDNNNEHHHQHDLQSSNHANNTKPPSWRTRFKMADLDPDNRQLTHHRHDNQIDECETNCPYLTINGNSISSSSSSLSIIKNETAPSVTIEQEEESACSLSLLSSSSDDNAWLSWLESDASSDASSTGGDAAGAVLVSSSDDEEETAEKGDHDGTSSGSDSSGRSDVNSGSSANYEPDWIKEDTDENQEDGHDGEQEQKEHEQDEEHDGDDEDDEALWGAFDVALQVHAGYEPADTLLLEDVHEAIDLGETGYDGSVSSASSLDDSESELTADDDDNDLDQYTEGFVVSRVHTSRNSDTPVSSLSSHEDELDSSVSSFQSSLGDKSQRERVDDVEDPLSSSCDDDAHAKGSRWIETIPVLAAFSTTDADWARDNVVFTPAQPLPQPRVWQQHEYVVVQPYSARQRRGRGRNQNGIFEVGSIESLSEDEEDQDDCSASAGALSLAPVNVEIPLSDRYHEGDAYVCFSDLSGVIERHVPAHRSGVFVDLGCGTSRLCMDLVLHGYRFVYGIDRDAAVIAYQRLSSPGTAALKSYVQFLRMDISQSLLFPDQSCDCIMSKATFDEIATRSLCGRKPVELFSALRETIRCLKHGGILMVVAFQQPFQYDEGTADGDILPEDSTPVERRSYRLEAPWWRWTEIQELLAHELTLIAQYELGCPRRQDDGNGHGKPIKPYVVLVWRRNESDRQRLLRLAAEIKKRKRMQCEYDTRVEFQSRRRQRDQNESMRVQELRQMILEDELARHMRWRDKESQELHQRVLRLAAFYDSLLEIERSCMVTEDTDARRRRDDEREIVTSVVEVILQLVDAVVARRQTTAVATLAQATEPAPVDQLEYVATASRVPSPDQATLVPVEESAAAHQVDTCLSWIREEVQRIVAIAETIVSNKEELQKPVQHWKSHSAKAPSAGSIEKLCTTALLVGGCGNSSPEETKTETTTREAAQYAVQWIVSSAVAAAASNRATTGDDAATTTINPPATTVEVSPPAVETGNEAAAVTMLLHVQVDPVVLASAEVVDEPTSGTSPLGWDQPPPNVSAPPQRTHDHTESIPAAVTLTPEPTPCETEVSAQTTTRAMESTTTTVRPTLPDSSNSGGSANDEELRVCIQVVETLVHQVILSNPQ